MSFFRKRKGGPQIRRTFLRILAFTFSVFAIGMLCWHLFLTNADKVYFKSRARARLDLALRESCRMRWETIPLLRLSAKERYELLDAVLQFSLCQDQSESSKTGQPLSEGPRVLLSRRNLPLGYSPRIPCVDISLVSQAELESNTLLALAAEGDVQIGRTEFLEVSDFEYGLRSIRIRVFRKPVLPRGYTILEGGGAVVDCVRASIGWECTLVSRIRG